MTRTEELLALAEAATPGPWEFVVDGNFSLRMPKHTEGVTQMCSEHYYPWTPDRKEDWEFIAAANPETIKQLCLREQKLVELVRLQHEALVGEAMAQDHHSDEMITALEAFNKWEGE